MNILPLISAFILLFALGSYALVHEWKATLIEKRYMTGALRIERQRQAAFENELFKKCKGKKPHPKEKKASGEKQNKEYASPRTKQDIHPLGKLNISMLFQEDADPRLLPIAERLFKNIYERTEVYHEELEQELFDLVIKIAKEDPAIDSFEAIYAKLGKEHELLYKLIKGTHNYKLCSTIGYPALDDFFVIDPEWKRPIYFHKASQPLLQAIFAEPQLPGQIINIEKGKWEKDHKQRPITKKELEKLLLENRKNPPDYEKLFYFTSKSVPKKTKVYVDSTSNMTLKL